MGNEKKIKLSKALLTKSELHQLRGGGDVINRNFTAECSCKYNDYSAVQNLNTVEDCKCSCINPSPIY